MTDIQLKQCLEKFISAHKNIEERKDHIRDAIGIDIDGPFNKALYHGESAYMYLLDMATGVSGDDWLSWFIYENDCGDKKMEAGVEGNMRPIESIDDLIWVMKLPTD